MNLGYRTKAANPATLPGNGVYDIAFSPNGEVVAIMTQNGTGIYAYPWKDYHFGTKYADPTGGGVSNGGGLAWSPSGNAIASLRFNTPFVEAWRWSPAGFGTKYSNPAVLPTAGSLPKIAFSPNGRVLAMQGGATGNVHAYAWTDASGFGTKYGNPSVAASNTVPGLAWSKTGAALLVYKSRALTNEIIAYKWTDSGGFGTEYTLPSTVIGGTSSRGYSFSPDNCFVAIGIPVSPFIAVYRWDDGTGFGARIPNPGTLPPSSVLDTEWSPDGKYLVAYAQAASNSLHIWEWTKYGFGKKLSVVAAQQPPQGTNAAVDISPTGTIGVCNSTTAPKIVCYQDLTTPIRRNKQRVGIQATVTAGPLRNRIGKRKFTN